MWSTLLSVKVAPFTVSVVKRLVWGFFQDLHGFYDTQDIHQHDAAAQRPAMDMARYGWVFWQQAIQLRFGRCIIMRTTAGVPW